MCCFNPCCSGLVGETGTSIAGACCWCRFNPCCSGLVGETAPVSSR